MKLRFLPLSSGENPCGQQPTYLLQFPNKQHDLVHVNVRSKAGETVKASKQKKIVAKKTLNHKSFSRTPLEVAAYCFWCATPLPKLMILQVCPFRSYHLHPPILSGLEEWSSTKIPPSYYSGLQTASQHPFTKAAAKLRSLPH